VYDVGRFKWKEKLLPGYACIVDVNELPWMPNDDRSLPHKPLTRFLFMQPIDRLQNHFGMKLAGFSLTNDKLILNCGFNTSISNTGLSIESKS
jgi:hypothetical protein